MKKIIRISYPLVIPIVIIATIVQLFFFQNLSNSWQLTTQLCLWLGIIYLLLTSMLSYIEPSPKSELISDLGQHQSSASYSYAANRYGIGYESIKVIWRIEENGSASLKRVITINAFSRIEELDTYLLIPENAPEDEVKRQIKIAQPKSLTPGRDVLLKLTEQDNRRSSALITISPPLNHGEKMAYEMTEQLSGNLYAINLTEEQISNRETPYDYCGWNINRPTKRATLCVEFPKEFRPHIYSSEVRYASSSGLASTQRQYDEEKRFTPQLKSNPYGDRFTLELDIEYPMIGLIYILRWEPIPIDKDNSSH